MRTFVLSSLMMFTIMSQSLLAQSSPLAENEKAVLSFDFQMDLLKKSAVGKKIMAMAENMQPPGAEDDGPDPTKLVKVSGAASLPENIQSAMELQMGGMPMEFHLRMQFEDAAEVAKMVAKAKEENSGVVKKNGKTYYKPPQDAGTPPGLMMTVYDSKTLEFGTEKYVTGGFEKSPVTAGLGNAISATPDSKALRLMLDLEGAKGLISEAVAMGKQQAPNPMVGIYLDLVDNIKDFRLTLDFASDELLTLQATGVDSGQAEEFKEGLDSLLGTAKEGGKMAVMQMQESDPDTAGVVKEILNSLNAEISGAEVSVKIPKPENFDVVIPKLIEKLPMMMMGGGF